MRCMAARCYDYIVPLTRAARVINGRYQTKTGALNEKVNEAKWIFVATYTISTIGKFRRAVSSLLIHCADGSFA